VSPGIAPRGKDNKIYFIIRCAIDDKSSSRHRRRLLIILPIIYIYYIHNTRPCRRYTVHFGVIYLPVYYYYYYFFIARRPPIFDGGVSFSRRRHHHNAIYSWYVSFPSTYSWYLYKPSPLQQSRVQCIYDASTSNF